MYQEASTFQPVHAGGWALSPRGRLSCMADCMQQAPCSWAHPAHPVEDALESRWQSSAALHVRVGEWMGHTSLGMWHATLCRNIVPHTAIQHPTCLPQHHSSCRVGHAAAGASGLLATRPGCCSAHMVSFSMTPTPMRLNIQADCPGPAACWACLLHSTGCCECCTRFPVKQAAICTRTLQTL